MNPIDLPQDEQSATTATDYVDDPAMAHAEPVESNGSSPSSIIRERIPLMEETLEPNVVRKQIGSILIHKHIETQTLRNEVELRRDDVKVEQLMVEEVVEERRDPWYEGETLIIPVYEEVLVTEKRLMLTKLVRVQQGERIEQTTVEGDVRREVISVEARPSG